MLKLQEVIILRQLDSHPNYAYDLARILNVQQSTMAYILKRLANLGYCEPRKKRNAHGPNRIYYHITDRGRNILRKDAISILHSTQREAEIIISTYSAHQKTIQLLREIGGL